MMKWELVVCHFAQGRQCEGVGTLHRLWELLYWYGHDIFIIAFTGFINAIDAVSIAKFYLVWLSIVEKISELGKIVRCLSSPFTDLDKLCDNVCASEESARAPPL